MSSEIRFGIAGAGVFGNYHANKCASYGDVNLVGVYDPNVKAAQKTALKYHAKPYADFTEMLRDVDAVIIASAAQSHAGLAQQALKLGRHCLIEKPITATLNEAEVILKLAKKSETIVQSGHQERFVVQAIGLSEIEQTPKFIRAHRMGTYSARGTDVSVTLDLMSHDLDLCIWLMNEFPKVIAAKTQIVHSEYADTTEASLMFSTGQAELTASRVSDISRRTMELQYESGTVFIDFNAKTIEHDTPYDLNLDFKSDPIASDSLMAGLKSFVKAIKGQAPPAISAQAGYDAMKLALMIDNYNNN